MYRELGMFYQGAHLEEDAISRTDLGPIPKYNSKANKEKLYGTQSGNCNGCREHFEARHLEVDHIVATAKGGTDHLDNLQLLCGSCNKIKGHRGMDYLFAQLKQANLLKGLAESL